MNSSAAQSLPTAGWDDGYCDATGFGNEGACETDDKGSFANVQFRGSSWTAAIRVCAALCLKCQRCRYISVSLHWNDCSWFNECDMRSLHRDVPGHKSLKVPGHEDASNGYVNATPDSSTHRGSHLWAYLRGLSPIKRERCWVDSCERPGNHALIAVAMAPVASTWAVNAEAKGSYGHIWRVVETFFQCAVLGGFLNASTGFSASSASSTSSVVVYSSFATMPPPAFRRVLIPARMQHKSNTIRLFRELRVLFSGDGSRMKVMIEDLMPHCPPWWEVNTTAGLDPTCCVNQTARQEMQRTYGDDLSISEMRDLRPSNLPEHLRAMRHVVWANLGVAQHQPDTAVFVSNEGASNGRRIADELLLAQAVKTCLAILRPNWRFRHQRLESLSYYNELRLLRRTTLMIALFGSSLHNCRFLPEGAMVLEIHGALKGETSRSAFSLYPTICRQEMGLDYAAYVPPGWDCSVLDGSCTGYLEAHVEPMAFVRFVAAALAGNLSSLDHDFVRATTGGR